MPAINANDLPDGQRPPLYGGARERDQGTPGELLVRSDSYQAWIAHFPDGAPRHGSAFGNQTEMRLPLSEILGRQRMRALITSADASAGSLVAPDHRGLLDEGAVRPLTVLELVSHVPTSSDLVEYAAEVSRTEAAAIVSEASALTGSTGTKPEGSLVFELRTAPVRTIPVWLPVTRRIITDAPALRGLVDAYLSADARLELEDQVVAGDGLGDNFEGILTNPDTQAADQTDTVGGTGNVLDILRAAKRKVRTGGRTTPNAAVVNPEDAEAIDTLKASTAGIYLGQNPYAFAAGNQRVWGMRLVESEAVPAGTALVGDFSRAVVFDRETVNMQIGTVGDDFIRNIVRVLAELRAAFGVLRPKAFCVADLTVA